MRAIMRTRSGWTPAANKIYGPRLVAVTTTSDNDASNFYARHYPSSFWEAYLAVDLRKHEQYRGLPVIRYPREYYYGFEHQLRTTQSQSSKSGM